MDKIEIDLTNVHRDEIVGLKEYLENNCWSWEEIKEEENDNRVVEILQHNVEYWFHNDDKYVDGICLTDSDIEQITYMIEEGYSEGEIVSEGASDIYNVENGWWRIAK